MEDLGQHIPPVPVGLKSLYDMFKSQLFELIINRLLFESLVNDLNVLEKMIKEVMSI